MSTGRPRPRPWPPPTCLRAARTYLCGNYHADRSLLQGSVACTSPGTWRRRWQGLAGAATAETRATRTSSNCVQGFGRLLSRCSGPVDASRQRRPIWIGTAAQILLAGHVSFFAKGTWWSAAGAAALCHARHGPPRDGARTGSGASRDVLRFAAANINQGGVVTVTSVLCEIDDG